MSLRIFLFFEKSFCRAGLEANAGIAESLVLVYQNAPLKIN
jgi:hypothetical protein